MDFAHAQNRDQSDSAKPRTLARFPQAVELSRVMAEQQRIRAVPVLMSRCLLGMPIGRR